MGSSYFQFTFQLGASARTLRPAIRLDTLAGCVAATHIAARPGYQLESRFRVGQWIFLFPFLIEITNDIRESIQSKRLTADAFGI